MALSGPKPIDTVGEFQLRVRDRTAPAADMAVFMESVERFGGQPHFEKGRARVDSEAWP